MKVHMSKEIFWWHGSSSEAQADLLSCTKAMVGVSFRKRVNTLDVYCGRNFLGLACDTRNLRFQLRHRPMFLLDERVE